MQFMASAKVLRPTVSPLIYARGREGCGGGGGLVCVTHCLLPHRLLQYWIKTASWVIYWPRAVAACICVLRIGFNAFSDPTLRLK